jgi:GcrA cell cycle regulator
MNSKHPANTALPPDAGCGAAAPQDCRPTTGGPHVTPWSDAEKATLRRLWADGLSAAEISQRLHGRSRNAVIGAVHRLNLETRDLSTRNPGPPRPKAKRKAPPKPLPPPVPIIAPQPAPWPVPDTSITLEHVRVGQCRDIPGDPRLGAQAIMCGAPVKFGSSYCPYHHSIYWHPHVRVRRPRQDCVA